mmetsp:Transcript_5244/g.14857  ORF Transcript_5244/g.14857 Transcript_5244/m.14857 type:complete len:461 (+) Transcript_5244:1711-3093(+)
MRGTSASHATLNSSLLLLANWEVTSRTDDRVLDVESRCPSCRAVISGSLAEQKGPVDSEGESSEKLDSGTDDTVVPESLRSGCTADTPDIDDRAGESEVPVSCEACPVPNKRRVAAARMTDCMEPGRVPRILLKTSVSTCGDKEAKSCCAARRLSASLSSKNLAIIAKSLGALVSALATCRSTTSPKHRSAQPADLLFLEARPCNNIGNPLMFEYAERYCRRINTMDSRIVGMLCPDRSMRLGMRMEASRSVNSTLAVAIPSASPARSSRHAFQIWVFVLNRSHVTHLRTRSMTSTRDVNARETCRLHACSELSWSSMLSENMWRTNSSSTHCLNMSFKVAKTAGCGTWSTPQYELASFCCRATLLCRGTSTRKPPELTALPSASASWKRGGVKVLEILTTSDTCGPCGMERLLERVCRGLFGAETPGLGGMSITSRLRRGVSKEDLGVILPSRCEPSRS